MALFALNDDLIALNSEFDESSLVEPANALLLQKQVPAEPFQIQMEHFFRLFYVPLDAITEPRWAFFTYWDYDPRENCSRLAYASGLELEGEQFFPRVIQNGNGIIGCLAQRFSSSNDGQPHISEVYAEDPLHRAHKAVKDLELASGIAVPLSLAGHFSGILKMHFRYPLAPTVSKASQSIMYLFTADQGRGASVG